MLKDCGINEYNRVFVEQDLFGGTNSIQTSIQGKLFRF